MPKTRKKLFPKNLLDYEVFIEDKLPSSEYFEVISLPQMFTGGHNSFLLNGSGYLLDGSQIQIEILDSLGNTIYHNPIKNYVEGTSIIVSVEIYEDTPPGFAKLIILGKLASTSDGTPIPQEWEGFYNVRWTKQIMVEPRSRSKSPIKFLNQPRLFVEEKRYYNVATSSVATVINNFTASLSPIMNSAEHVGYLISAESPTTFSADYYNAVITGSIEVDGVGGNVNIVIDNILNTSSMFTNNSIITLDNGRTIENILLRSGSYATTVFGNTISNVTSSAIVRYEQVSIENTNIPISYAKLRVANINTVSGEIFKVKVYNKIITNVSDYKLIADALVTTENLIVTQSIRGELPAGDFYISPTASQNWYSDKLTSSIDILYPISGTAPYYNSNTTLMPFQIRSDDSVLISSIYSDVPVENNQFTGSVSSSGYFIGTKQPITVFAATEYTLQLDATYKKQSGSANLIGNTPLVNIYIVGVDGSKIIDDNPLGQLIGKLEVEAGAETRWYQSNQFNFYPKLVNSGSIGLRFEVTNGFWNFSDISIKPASDALFAPDEAQFLIPNVEFFNSILEYKMEFFDINNNSADVVAVSAPTFFTGSNIDLGVLP